MKFQPLSNFIVFDVVPKKKSIIKLDKKQLPKSEMDLVVLAIGEEVKNVQVGDLIEPDTAPQKLATCIEIDGKEVFILRESNLFGIYGRGVEISDKKSELIS
jgi:hypothetical protein